MIHIPLTPPQVTLASSAIDLISPTTMPSKQVQTNICYHTATAPPTPSQATLASSAINFIYPLQTQLSISISRTDQHLPCHPPLPCPPLAVPVLYSRHPTTTKTFHGCPQIGSQAPGGSSIVDTMKLVVLGGTVETARRVSSSAWTSFVNCESPSCHSTHAEARQRSSSQPTSAKRTIPLTSSCSGSPN